ncbi:MAG: hypothetical protein MJ188_01075 [Treponema sp.]|nr:hypothetical protein [Treponema sp.]
MERRTLLFRQLRDYLKNEYYFINGVPFYNINEAFGKLINKDHKTVERLLLNQSKNYKVRPFLSRSEAEIIVNEIRNGWILGKDYHDETGFLNYLLDAFLEEHKQAQFEIANESDGYTNFTKRKETVDISLEEIKQEIKKRLDAVEFVFLSGLPGNGKNYISTSIARDYFDSGDAQFAIRFTSEDLKSYADFFRKLLEPMHKKLDLMPLSIEQLEKKTTEFLKENTTLIYLENFESIEDFNVQKSIIEYLSTLKQKEKYINLFVIITSNFRASSFPFVYENQYFEKIEIQSYEETSLKEWINYLSHEKTINQAFKRLNKSQKADLDNFLIQNFKTRSTIKRSLLYIAEKINEKEDLDEIIKDFFKKRINEFEISPQNYLKGLSDGAISILIALSVMQMPVSAKRLSCISEVSGLDKDNNPTGDLCYAIKECDDRYFLDICTTKDNTVTYNIVDEIKAIIIQERTNHYNEKYKAIVENWLYKEL